MTKNKSLRKLYFHRQQIFKSPVKLAYVGDEIISSERQRIANEISLLLGYDLKKKDELTQYVYRKKSIRYKINGRGYALIKKTTDPKTDCL